MGFSVFPQLLLPGLTTGCVYALIALGFVLCYNVSNVINMAQGEYVMLGGLLAAWMHVDGHPAAARGAARDARRRAARRRAGAPHARAGARRARSSSRSPSRSASPSILRGFALIFFGKDPIAPAGLQRQRHLLPVRRDPARSDAVGLGRDRADAGRDVPVPAAHRHRPRRARLLDQSGGGAPDGRQRRPAHPHRVRGRGRDRARSPAP